MNMHWTIGKKMVVSGVVTTTLLALILTGIALWQNNQSENIAEEEVLRLANSGQEDVLKGVVAMLTSQQEILEQKVGADLNVARDILQQTGVVGFAATTQEWQATNQFTQTKTTVNLPDMMFGSVSLGQNADVSVPSAVVDKVRSLVGGTCTIFQRMNEQGEMLRVCTNVETLDGKRAIGTYIPTNNADGTSNPVLQKVLAGERFVGRAFVVNKWYVTAYEPILDQGNKIVGMLFVGVPEESAESVRKQIMDIKVGETGYVYVLDLQGHYVISQNGERDGENIWEAKDADGNLFIQDIIKRAQELKSG